MDEKARRELHDQLLAQKPEAAVHDQLSCPWCIEAALEVATAGSDTGGKMADSKTFSQEEVDAAVAAAVAKATGDLQAQLDELKSEKHTSEVEQQIAEAKAEVEAQLADTKSKLDEAVLARQTAEQEAADIKAFLEAEEARLAEEAEQASRRDERLKVVASFGFPDEYVNENADRFVAMSDEDFEAATEGWKTLRPAKTEETKDLPPGETVLKATRESKETGSKLSALREFRHARAKPANVA